MFSLKRSTVEAFAVPFTRKELYEYQKSVLILSQNWYLLGMKKFQARSTRQDLGTSFFFRNFRRATPSSLHLSVPSPPPPPPDRPLSLLE